MKRLLIPTYSFAPLNTIAAHRLVKLAKYLPAYGWEPVVVAPCWTPMQLLQTNRATDPQLAEETCCRVVQVHFRSRQELKSTRFSKLWSRLCLNTAYAYGTLPTAILEQCREICRAEQFDAIFASSYPQFVHWIAHRLHREFRIPWVADHRDLVDEMGLTSSSPVQRTGEWLRHRIIVAGDSRLTRSAAAITTVSEPLASTLRVRNQAPVHVVMNGFDPQDFPPLTGSPPRNSRFTIVYTGEIARGSDPLTLLRGIEVFLQRNPAAQSKIQVVWYGGSSKRIASYEHDLQRRGVLVSGGVLPHKEAVAQMCRADVLCFLSYSGKGILSGKMFEYLGARRPILSVPGDDDVTDRLLAETNAGVVGRSPEEVASILGTWYYEWKETGSVASHANADRVDMYSRQAAAATLADILHNLA